MSGLTAGGLSLANGSDTVSPAANATTFSFPTTITSGANYAVTVSAQPTGQTCVLANGSGIISANVTNVQVTCTTNTYNIGGTLSGLTAAGLTLANGSDTVTPASGATTFTLPTKLTTGTTYSVTVSTQPTGEKCTVSSGSGTVGSADINNVKVTCAAVVAASWHTALVGPGHGQNAQLASDPSDSAFFVAWPQTGLAAPSAPNIISASRFTDAAGWSTPVAIATSSSLSSVSGLGFDNQGKGYALFSYDAQTVASSRYTPAVGWTAQTLASPSSPPVTFPPNTLVSTQAEPEGLVVFGDGAATGLVLTATTANLPAGQPPYRDLPFRRVNATPSVDFLTYGAAEPELAQPSDTPIPYQYTNNGVTYTTQYYYSGTISLDYDAMVSAPTAHNYAAKYLETDSTFIAQTDQYGNHLATTTLKYGVVLWVNEVPHPVVVSSVTSFNPAPAARLISGGIAVSDNGTALVAWSELTGDGTALNFYAVRFDGTAWTAPQLLGTFAGPYVPTQAAWVAAAINGTGDGIIFFSTIDSTAVGAMNAVRVDGKTGAFGTPVQVSIAGNYAPAPWKALLDAQGNAYIMETRGVFRLAAGSNSYDAKGLACTCDNNTGGQMKLDRDGFPMAIWGDANGLEAARYH